MARKQNKKKQQKRKDRERRNRKNRKALTLKRLIKSRNRLVRREAPLPEFKIITDPLTRDVEDLVSASIEKLKTIYTSMDDAVLSILHGQHRLGWEGLVDEHAADIPEVSREEAERSLIRIAELHLGTAILRAAPDHLKRRALPTGCFSMIPDDREWVIECRSMIELRKNGHGRIYQSPYKPTLTFDGEDLKVVFTPHAALQLADRLIPHWSEVYIAHLYVFGFFYECTHFEPTRLRGGQPAMRVYNSCLRAGRAFREFMMELTGVGSIEGLKDYYYVVGYCPLVIDEGMAIAKTFLTPGYRQTPERRTLRKSGRLALMRDIEMASDDGINVDSVTRFERARAAVRWFHDNGVEQVKRIEHEVFREMSGPHSWSSSTESGEGSIEPA